MSGAELPNELTGAFLEVAEVTDLGMAGESETIVGTTKADVTFSTEQERAEANVHSDRRTKSKPTYNAPTLEVPTLLTPGANAMETFGVVDSGGEEDVGSTWEACRIHIYDVPPSEATGDPKQSFEFEGVEWQLDEMSAGEDFVELTLTGMVHSDWRRGTTTA